jgi:hypothetical protein
LTDLFGGLIDQPQPKRQEPPTARASSNGRTTAFEADNAGSIPAARSTADRDVATFACPCGAQDEVAEPAPDLVDCWRCKAALAMYRWFPPTPAPNGNARQLTAGERSRI